jgi:hypothetical protein
MGHLSRVNNAQYPIPNAQCPMPSVNTVFFVKMVLKSIEKVIFGSKLPY